MMATTARRHTAWALRRVLVALLVAHVPLQRAQTPQPNAAAVLEAELDELCTHEKADNVATGIQIQDGDTMYREIKENQTHRYFYRNFNTSQMAMPDDYRKLIIDLEPCRGIVYLFVRKTSRCYPNPYSCILLGPSGYRISDDCAYTHFMSVIDGSRDGAPTFFQIPLSTTKYFISVFAAADSQYTLTLLGDVGAFPRPGNKGKIRARQLRELQVQISWEEADYFPLGISETKQYWIYSAMLLIGDNRTNKNVLMRPEKIMNTVCGLKNNTDRHYDRVPKAMCRNGICNATIEGVLTNKRYVFNVIAESHRGFMMAYGGLIMKTEWDEITQFMSDRSLRVVGAVSGSVLALVVIIYFLMLKLYG
jgi:hypothetical protein